MGSGGTGAGGGAMGNITADRIGGGGAYAGAGNLTGPNQSGLDPNKYVSASTGAPQTQRIGGTFTKVGDTSGTKYTLQQTGYRHGEPVYSYVAQPSTTTAPKPMPTGPK